MLVIGRQLTPSHVLLSITVYAGGAEGGGGDGSGGGGDGDGDGGSSGGGALGISHGVSQLWQTAGKFDVLQ